MYMPIVYVEALLFYPSLTIKLAFSEPKTIPKDMESGAGPWCDGTNLGGFEHVREYFLIHLKLLAGSSYGRRRGGEGERALGRLFTISQSSRTAIFSFMLQQH